MAIVQLTDYGGNLESCRQTDTAMKRERCPLWTLLSAVWSIIIDAWLEKRSRRIRTEFAILRHLNGFVRPVEITGKVTFEHKAGG